MASIYERGRALSQRLLDPSRFGQGTIELVRYTPGAAPANEWDPPNPPIPSRTVLKGAASGVSASLVGSTIANGVQVETTDLQVIVAPWGGEYETTDVLEIDGDPVTVLSYENIPAAGTVSVIRFIVRG
jgi:hypothetical protein|tara:strand:+ start:26193 stop:26579 length:387 start_codon:yes stop_codon:yes gene_type:complete